MFRTAWAELAVKNQTSSIYCNHHIKYQKSFKIWLTFSMKKGRVGKFWLLLIQTLTPRQIWKACGSLFTHSFCSKLQYLCVTVKVHCRFEWKFKHKYTFVHWLKRDFSLFSNIFNHNHQGRGAFNNYVDQIIPNFNPLPPLECTKMDILHATYPVVMTEKSWVVQKRKSFWWQCLILFATEMVFSL